MALIRAPAALATSHGARNVLGLRAGPSAADAGLPLEVQPGAPLENKPGGDPGGVTAGDKFGWLYPGL